MAMGINQQPGYNYAPGVPHSMSSGQNGTPGLYVPAGMNQLGAPINANGTPLYSGNVQQPGGYVGTTGGQTGTAPGTGYGSVNPTTGFNFQARGAAGAGQYDPLQGTQTGGILQNLNQGSQNIQQPQNGGALQSTIPSINGQNGYIPGQGMAPYAPQGGSTFNPKDPANFDKYGHMTPQAIQSYLQSIKSNGNSSIPSFNSSNTNMNPNVNTYPGGTPGANSSGGVLSSPTGMGTSGGSGGWMSPEEMRAATNALPNYIKPPTGGGGGAGATGSGGGGAPVGGGTGGNSGGQNGLPSGINGSFGNFPNNPVGTYAPPGGGAFGLAPGQGSQPGLQMQQSNPGSAIADYQNTPGYQLLMGNQQQQFQESPGYQYAVNQAMQQTQNGASARGLLESGSVLRDMTDRAQGMASQGYNDWWNKQNSSFNDYQNRLAGLAGGNVGGDQAMALGQSLGNNTSQMGGDLASLFGNQGAAGYGGMVNTGAAQAGNTGNAATQQAQIQGTNASTQLAGAVYNRGLF